MVDLGVGSLDGLQVPAAGAAEVQVQPVEAPQTVPVADADQSDAAAHRFAVHHLERSRAPP